MVYSPELSNHEAKTKINSWRVFPSAHSRKEHRNQQVGQFLQECPTFNTNFFTSQTIHMAECYVSSAVNLFTIKAYEIRKQLVELTVGYS